MGRSRVAKTVLIGVACVVAVSGAGDMFLRLTGIIDPDACISERMKTIPDLSGAKIDIIYTNCDTFAKDESIKVYFSQASVAEESWFANWRNHRTLIFDYDPGSHSDTPVIESLGKDRLMISIPEVSSVALRYQKWRDLFIDYKIDHIVNP
jgi:hypothetical protein